MIKKIERYYPQMHVIWGSEPSYNTVDKLSPVKIDTKFIESTRKTVQENYRKVTKERDVKLWFGRSDIEEYQELVRLDDVILWRTCMASGEVYWFKKDLLCVKK